MLHAEEGLWLVERGMLAVHPSLASSTSRAPLAGTPSAAADAATVVDTNEGDGEAALFISRPEAMQVEEMGEHDQGRELSLIHI